MFGRPALCPRATVLASLVCRRNRRLEFYCKYLIASALVLCSILLLSWYSVDFRSWVPLYGMTTVRYLLLRPYHLNLLYHLMCRCDTSTVNSCACHAWLGIPSVCCWLSCLSVPAQVAVVLSEKVDTTVSKGVLRILGTAVGGAFGACPTLCGHAPPGHHLTSTYTFTLS